MGKSVYLYGVEIMDGDGRPVGSFRADLVEEVCRRLNGEGES